MEYPIGSLLVILFSTSLTPGPNNIIGMTLGQKIGFRKSLPYVWGMLTGGTLQRIFLALFGNILFQKIPALIPIIAIIGMFYFIFMAYLMIIPSKRSDIKTSPIPLDKIFISGFFLQFINPKATISGVTLMTSFLFPYLNQNIVLLEKWFYIVLFVILLGVVAMIGILLWIGSGVIFSVFIRRYNKQFNLGIALLFLYIAWSIVQSVFFSSLAF